MRWFSSIRTGWHTGKKLVVPDNITLRHCRARAGVEAAVENSGSSCGCAPIESAVGEYRRNLRGLERLVERKIISRNPKMGPWVLINANWYYRRLTSNTIHFENTATGLVLTRC